MESATIKLFLVYGDPKKLRTAEISNWSGKAIGAPRTEFELFLSREECQQSGVYILSGVDSSSGKQMAYIGEAEVLKDRMKAHTSKDFWVQAYAFVSKDENLTKSHIRYLEGRLIEESKSINRFVLDNGQGSGSKLPESDREDMEVFLSKIRQLLPVLGSELLTPVSSHSPGEEREDKLVCAIKGLNAYGKQTPSGFLVFEGSQAVLEERPSASTQHPFVVKQRSEMIQDGTLSRKDDHYEFTTDVEFSSPSAAASVVHGGGANGLISWKNPVGKTLKEFGG
jgi:hypothetical protein